MPFGQATARRNFLVLAIYAAIAYAYFGIPLGSHFGRDLIGNGNDPQIFVWALAWWPHAILTWQNPIVSHAIYAPAGVNLAWVTTVPGLATAFAPITLLFGPDVSYNVAQILMPALSAWTAYLLCRQLTHSLWPAIAGGYLYGFSSYMLGAELGHLNLTAVFLLPLIALAVVRYLQGDIDGRGVGWRLGVLFALQFWISTEVCFDAAIVLGLAIVLAYATAPRVRRKLRELLRPLTGAVLLAAALSGPLLWYALTDFRSGSVYVLPSNADGDVLNIVVPTRLLAVGGPTFAHTSKRFFSDLPDQGLYLGVPTLAILAWYALGLRRSATRRFLIAALVLVVVLTLGTAVYVEGRRRLSLPWHWVARLPVLDNVLPVRFSVYAALAASVIVALWTAARRDWAGRLLPALAVASLVPALWHHPYRSHPERWPFFTSADYKCIPRDENVAIFPFGVLGNSTLWQAETGFWFRMPGGYLGPKPPPASLEDPTIRKITFTGEDPTVPEIIEMVRRERVDRVISIAIYAHPGPTEMHRFGELSVYTGLYIAPACGYSSLQKGIHPTPPHPGGA